MCSGGKGMSLRKTGRGERKFKQNTKTEIMKSADGKNRSPRFLRKEMVPKVFWEPHVQKA